MNKKDVYKYKIYKYKNNNNVKYLKYFNKYKNILNGSGFFNKYKNNNLNNQEIINNSLLLLLNDNSELKYSDKKNKLFILLENNIKKINDINDDINLEKNIIKNYIFTTDEDKNIINKIKEDNSDISNGTNIKNLYYMKEYLKNVHTKYINNYIIPLLINANIYISKFIPIIEVIKMIKYLINYNNIFNNIFNNNSNNNIYNLNLDLEKSKKILKKFNYNKEDKKTTMELYNFYIKTIIENTKYFYNEFNMLFRKKINQTNLIYLENIKFDIFSFLEKYKIYNTSFEESNYDDMINLLNKYIPENKCDNVIDYSNLIITIYRRLFVMDVYKEPAPY